MIPQGWNKAPLRELGLIQAGRQRSPHFTEGKLRPYLRVANVLDGYIKSSDVFTMPFTEQEYAIYQLRHGDILLNEGQSLELVGRSAMYRGDPAECCFQNTLIRFRSGPRIDSDFALVLFQFLMYSGRFSAIATQTTSIAHLGVARFASLEVLVPPLTEQTRIANAVGMWDRAIGLTVQLIAAKKRRKRALMQQLLSGRLRFSDIVGSDESNNVAVRAVSLGWEMRRLGDLISPIARTESIDPDKTYRLIGVRWYTEGAHIHTTLPGKQIATTSLSRAESDDITYNKMWASKGAFAITKAEHAGAYGTTEYPQFRAKPGKLSIHFLEQVFHDPRFRHEAKGLCRGTTERARLNPSDFLQIEIPVPSLPEQERIATVLQACDDELRLLDRKVALLKRQKQGLMQQLVRGRIRVDV